MDANLKELKIAVEVVVVVEIVLVVNITTVNLRDISRVSSLSITPRFAGTLSNITTLSFVFKSSHTVV